MMEGEQNIEKTIPRIIDWYPVVLHSIGAPPTEGDACVQLLPRDDGALTIAHVLNGREGVANSRAGDTGERMVDSAG